MAETTKVDDISLAKLVGDYMEAADAEVARWKARTIQATNELTEQREEVRKLAKELNHARSDLDRAESDERVRLDQERIEKLVEECSAAWELVAKAEGATPADSSRVSFEDLRLREVDEDPEVVAETKRKMAERMKSRFDPEIMHALSRIYHAKLHATKKGSESDALTWWGPVDCAFFHLFRERPAVEADIHAEMRVAAGIGKPDRFFEDDGDDD